MTPSVGRIVVVRAAPHQNNGADEAPAVVTRVWGQRGDGAWTVNLRVLLDGSDVTPAKTSVALFPDRDAAVAAATGPTDTYVAWWPPRV